MQSKQSETSTTSKIQVRFLSLDDLPKVVENMKNAFAKLFKAMMDAQSEYTIYISQKTFTEQNYSHDKVEKCHSMFAKDFADFKEKLNEAIRIRNKYYEDFKFQLAMLGSNNPQKDELKLINDTLNQLKALYERDKPLYVQQKVTKNTSGVTPVPKETLTTETQANKGMGK